MEKDPREFIPEPYAFNMTEALSVGWQTTTGGGNCFSVEAADGQYYCIVNFYIDDDPFSNKNGLKTLLKKGLTWPIKIAILAENTAVINDPRIDEKHYRSEFCEVCCPMDLLPLPQRLAKSRRIMVGTTSFIKAEPWDSPWGRTEGMVIESTKINADPDKKLRDDWKVEINPVQIYCLEDPK